MPLARSRYRGGIGSIGRVEMGQGTFSQTSTPSCPPGQHWVAPAASAVRGMGACVPNTVLHLTLRPPPPPPPPPVKVIPLTLPGLRQPQAPIVQPSAPTSAPAPTEATLTPEPTTSCPPLWPWWWILVAGVLGLGAGYYAEQNQKKVKKNAGRYASRIVNRAGDAAIARLLG